MNSFLFLLLLWSLIESLKKGIDVYHVFIDGVKEGLKLIIIIFPALMLLTLWVNLLQSCGLLELLQSFLMKICQFFSIPVDILLMCLIRPISSQGSLVILKNIYDLYGVDHVYSLLGSIIQTGSDTTLYVVSLYFQSVKTKKVGLSLMLGLFLDLVACLIAFGFYHLFIV